MQFQRFGGVDDPWSLLVDGATTGERTDKGQKTKYTEICVVISRVSSGLSQRKRRRVTPKSETGIYSEQSPSQIKWKLGVLGGFRQSDWQFCTGKLCFRSTFYLQSNGKDESAARATNSLLKRPWFCILSRMAGWTYIGVGVGEGYQLYCPSTRL